MEFNDPALEHLVNKITVALNENNKEDAAHYMDIIIDKYPEVANILMNSIEFQNIMAQNEDVEGEEASDDFAIQPGSAMELDEEKIINDMNAMLDIEPTTAQEYIQKGTVLTVTEEYEKALECFDKALELDENNLSALISKGNTLELMEKFDDASKVYDDVMNTEVEEVYDLMSKGYIFEGHQRYNDALKTYDKALQKERYNANILFLKGSCLIKLEQYQKAIDSLEEAIERYSENPYETIFELENAYHNKGVSLHAIGEDDDALEAFSLALGLNPEYYYSYYEIGIIQEDREKYDSALKNYNKFLEYDNTDSEVVEAKERVEELLKE
ncbi:TPR repeat-containing protein [Methanobrevibacter ruminantium M1]|uniref:TPR repeat-containing protein n=1 Tax=Methanobrevibacter ruminantium (strain ATCC 35063 / DSM 1093 / JCM 13430 / OCM 146 / M1) TaxID=634498 RepID=D3E0Z2_METRM|nr:tetratricopeptide repeat protein [Methanobrevibacter ruminantium]ADC47966.1 TPR repeat-containing protein [Methanobrevibacter ruminantium M1]